MEEQFSDPLLLKNHSPTPPMQEVGDTCRTCKTDELRAMHRRGKHAVVFCARCDSVQKWPLHA